MAILRIYTYDEPVLREVAQPVEHIERSVRKLADDMVETMYAAPGIGLAANQVGRLQRIIVVNVDTKSRGSRDKAPIVLVNPSIVKGWGTVKHEEGCLSVPNFYAKVKRYEKVLVHGLDLDGNKREIEAEGLLAVVFQHEIDHLNGYLFVDRLGPVGRELFNRKWRKLQDLTHGA